MSRLARDQTVRYKAPAMTADGLCRRPPHRGTNPPESAGIRRYPGLKPDDLVALGSSQNARKRRGFATLSTAGQGWSPHH